MRESEESRLLFRAHERMRMLLTRMGDVWGGVTMRWVGDKDQEQRFDIVNLNCSLDIHVLMVSRTLNHQAMRELITTKCVMER